MSGEADTTTAESLREVLATQLDTGARLVTVDASELLFLDSATLRVLVLAAKALRGRHGTLVLAHPQPIVARLLEITGADTLLDVRELAGQHLALSSGSARRAGPGAEMPSAVSNRICWSGRGRSPLHTTAAVAASGWCSRPTRTISWTASAALAPLRRA
jgi:anti-anti-sigma factor